MRLLCWIYLIYHHVQFTDVHRVETLHSAVHSNRRVANSWVRGVIFGMFMCTYVCMSVCLFVWVFFCVFKFVYLFVCLFVCLFMFVCSSLCLFIAICVYMFHLYVFLLVFLSVHLYDCTNIHMYSMWLQYCTVLDKCTMCVSLYSGTCI